MKLLQRMREELQLRNSSEETIATYLGCVERFTRYYGQSPEQLNAEQVRSYLLHLLQERKLSWPAIHVARAALRFLSVRVLKQRWFDEEIQCPKRPLPWPTVLSAEEITRILDHTRHLKHWTILATLYATGLRSKEVRLLKSSDIDSQRMVLPIRNGKGQVPRDLGLSPRLCSNACGFTGAGGNPKSGCSLRKNGRSIRWAARVCVSCAPTPDNAPAFRSQFIPTCFATMRRWCINPFRDELGSVGLLYQMRCETGIPSWVMRLITEQATRASVFCAWSVRARSADPIRAL